MDTGKVEMNDSMEITYRPIGRIHTPFTELAGMPIQTAAAQGIPGTIDLFEPFEPGLKDLLEFSHVILLYHLHLVEAVQLVVTPFLDTVEHGIFATRAPKRPNPIGLSVVRLRSIVGCRLDIEDVDILDGTPLLDIKPCIPAFDQPQVERIGWLQGKFDDLHNKRSDQRFK